MVLIGSRCEQQTMCGKIYKKKRDLPRLASLGFISTQELFIYRVFVNFIKILGTLSRITVHSHAHYHSQPIYVSIEWEYISPGPTCPVGSCRILGNPRGKLSDGGICENPIRKIPMTSDEFPPNPIEFVNFPDKIRRDLTVEWFVLGHRQTEAFATWAYLNLKFHLTYLNFIRH